MVQNKFSLSDLKYTLCTMGYKYVIEPYYQTLIARQEKTVEAFQRRLRQDNLEEFRYHVGVLEGMKAMYHAPKALEKTLVIRSQEKS